MKGLHVVVGIWQRRIELVIPNAEEAKVDSVRVLVPYDAVVI